MRRSRSPLVLASCVLLLSGCQSTADGPAARVDPSGTATPSDTPSATPTATPTATVRAMPGAPGAAQADVTVLPTAIPRSRAPRLSYVSGTVLHRPDGARLRLDLRLRDPWGVTSIIPAAGGGYLATDDHWFEGTVGMHRLGPDGRAVDAWASTGPARLGPDGQVAWMEVPVPESMQDGRPRLHVDDRVQELPGHLQPYILQFDGALVVYDATVLRPRRARRTFETAAPGDPRPTARPRERFPSPGHAHWWQWNRGRLELGAGEAALVKVRDRGLLGTGTEPVWEDDRHLLVTLRRGDRQALLRIGVDGSVARATAWTHASIEGHAVLPGSSRPAAAGD